MSYAGHIFKLHHPFSFHYVLTLHIKWAFFSYCALRCLSIFCYLFPFRFLALSSFFIAVLSLSLSTSCVCEFLLGMYLFSANANRLAKCSKTRTNSHCYKCHPRPDCVSHIRKHSLSCSRSVCISLVQLLFSDYRKINKMGILCIQIKEQLFPGSLFSFL